MQLFVITSLLISHCMASSQEQQEQKSDPASTTISRVKYDPDSCSDISEENCFFDQLDAWFDKLQNKSLGGILDDNVQNQDLGQTKIDPIFKVVKCGDDVSTWKYKYTGQKGKKRIFKGKGKLSFVKASTPPHGFDYGMKSGHCLILNDENIKSIEGFFDEEGMLYGNNILYSWLTWLFMMKFAFRRIRGQLLQRNPNQGQLCQRPASWSRQALCG